MQEELFPAAEKILSDLENIFKKDQYLNCFEIIPVEDNENKSPVFHYEKSLGLASWCIQPLYCYVYNRLLGLKQNSHRREEPAVISRWLLGALLLNPDVSTFWNMKRELIKNGRNKPSEDLRFVNMIIYYKSKCFEAFSYRRWLFKLILIDSKESTCNIELLFRNEFEITLTAANRYGNNCYAWSHREHIISMLESLFPNKFNTFLDNEWHASTGWCNCHVSDYSGFTYRQFLLKKLLSRDKNSDQLHEILAKRKKIVLEFVKTATRNFKDNILLQNHSHKELLDLLHGITTAKSSEINFEQTLINLSYWVEDCNLNEDLINTFPGHEALWNHRRFLFFSLLALNYSYTNFFFYNIKSFNALQITETFSINNKNLPCILTSETVPQSLLEIAFSLRNKELINQSKQSGLYQNNLAEKFYKFLIYMKV